MLDPLLADAVTGDPVAVEIAFAKQLAIVLELVLSVWENEQLPTTPFTVNDTVPRS
jgi:hypothetical protein